MKKITFLAIFLLCFFYFPCFSQNTVIERPVDPAEYLWVLSTKGTDGTMIVGADSFVLEKETAIGEIDVPGGLKTNIGYLGNLEKGFNVYIYADDNGEPAGDPSQPGTGLVELSDIDPVYYSKYENGLAFYNRTDFNNIQITDANGGEQVVLPPGTYWISFFVTVEGAPDGQGKWAWIGSVEPNPAPPYEPLVIDPLDVLEGGLTNWTKLSSGGVNYPSLGWTMRDEQILDVKENNLSKISIYPNPASDIVTLSIPNTLTITNIRLFDVTGKQISTTQLNIDNQLDVSFLAKGMYTLSIETDNGSINKRIIKE